MKYLSICILILGLLSACGVDSAKVNDKSSESASQNTNKSTPPSTRKDAVLNLNTFEGQLVALSGIYLKYNTNGQSKTDKVKAELAKIDHKDLAKAKNFVFESSQKSSKLLSKSFLQKPTKKELQTIYQLRFINWNSMSTTAVTEAVLDKLDLSKVADTDLLTAYYRLLVGPLATNRTKPDLFRGVNINLNELGFENEKEKGILFYSLASKFANKYNSFSRIKKEDCTKTKEMSRSFPQINGKNIFEATPPKFEDFNFILSNNAPDASFKRIHTASYEKAKAHYLKCKF